LQELRQINNLPVFQGPKPFDPDHVHHLFNNLANLSHPAWPEIGRKFQEASAISGFSLQLLVDGPHRRFHAFGNLLHVNVSGGSSDQTQFPNHN
jgi:hypothetical protein